MEYKSNNGAFPPTFHEPISSTQQQTPCKTNLLFATPRLIGYPSLQPHRDLTLFAFILCFDAHAASYGRNIFLITWFYYQCTRQ
jgi:hypothetical protein